VAHSAVNLQYTDHLRSHHTSNALLHYLVNIISIQKLTVIFLSVV